MSSQKSRFWLLRFWACVGYGLTYIHCVRKKRDQNVFFVIKLGQLWWNLVHSFLNKFATKSCKWFPPHLNNVSSYATLWNLKCSSRTCYTIELLDKLQNFSHLTCGPQIRQIWIQLIITHIAREDHWSWAIDDTTDEWLPQWRHYPAWPTLFSVAVSVYPDLWYVFYTPSLAIDPTHCNQLDSNLANLEVVVEVR